jgi:hypothetical protein
VRYDDTAKQYGNSGAGDVWTTPPALFAAINNLVDAWERFIKSL